MAGKHDHLRADGSGITARRRRCRAAGKAVSGAASGLTDRKDDRWCSGRHLHRKGKVAARSRGWSGGSQPRRALSRQQLQHGWPSAVLEAHAQAARSAMSARPQGGDEWRAAADVLMRADGLTAALSASSSGALSGFYAALALETETVSEAFAAAPAVEDAVTVHLNLGLLVANIANIASWDDQAQAMRRIPAAVQDLWALTVARLLTGLCSYLADHPPAASSVRLTSSWRGTAMAAAMLARDAANLFTTLIQQGASAAATAEALQQPPAQALWRAILSHAVSTRRDDNALAGAQSEPRIIPHFVTAADTALKAAEVVLETARAAGQPSHPALQLAADTFKRQLIVAVKVAAAASPGRGRMDPARLLKSAQLLSALDSAGADAQAAAAAAGIGPSLMSHLVLSLCYAPPDADAFTRLCGMLAIHLERNTSARAVVLQGRSSHCKGRIWSQTAAEISAVQLQPRIRSLVEKGLRQIEAALRDDDDSNAAAEADAAAAADAAMQALLVG